MAEPQGSLDVGGKEEVLHDQTLGTAALDDLQELGVNEMKSLGEGDAGASNGSVFDELVGLAIRVDCSVAGGGSARVDTEDSQNTRRGSISVGRQGGFHLFFLDVEVGPDVLQIFVVLQDLHEP